MFLGSWSPWKMLPGKMISRPNCWRHPNMLWRWGNPPSKSRKKIRFRKYTACNLPRILLKEPFVSSRFDLFLWILEAQKYPKEKYFYRNMSFAWIFKGDFFTFYHAETTLNHHFGEICFFCSKHLLQIQVISIEFCLTAGGGILVRRIPIEGHLITPGSLT